MAGANGSLNGDSLPHLPVPAVHAEEPSRASQRQAKALLKRLQVPFEPPIIQWRVVEQDRTYGKLRGRVIPYADKFAYQERLNQLVGPVGWTQAVSVHTTPMIHRNQGERSAKLVVTCRLTIHVLGSHSSTGEEWVVDNNAATSAEAQAFKRACALFGLGAYLYYFFRGVWVDLGKDRQPLSPPTLPDWATPEGWKQGARPSVERLRDVPGAVPEGFDPQVIHEIEGMREALGAQIYRRMLKLMAMVWEPKQIADPQLARQVLAGMKTAENRMTRAAHALETIGKPAFEEIIRSFHLKSVSDFGDLTVLERLVGALEAKAESVPDA
jgi:hypothetical protein